MRRVFVTGASGFIGGRLVQRLVSAFPGCEVRCLVRQWSPELKTLGVVQVAGDLDGDRSHDLTGVDAVFHCAAMVSDWATVAEIRRVNVAGTSRLLAAATQARVRRFVHLSTTDVYGHPHGGPHDETTSVAPHFRNWYSQSKAEAEAEVWRAGAAGLPATILRPATVYGPGSVKVIGEIARALRAGQMIVIDRGRTVAGLCYVDNLIDALLAAACRNEAVGEAFNIADDEPTTWRDLLDDLSTGLDCLPVRFSLPYGFAMMLALACEHGYRVSRRITGLTLPPLLSRQAVQLMGIDQRFMTEKANRLLQHQPKVRYREGGLARTLAWLRGRE
jgi:nucleoside-diphosphate-sugar epimerase